ncbi:MAG: hypothetical protein QOI66_4691 [Myxococcales bacterium]|nr:hypothetical protein [Myxococcales bacterium]
MSHAFASRLAVGTVCFSMLFALGCSSGGSSGGSGGAMGSGGSGSGSGGSGSGGAGSGGSGSGGAGSGGSGSGGSGSGGSSVNDGAADVADAPKDSPSEAGETAGDASTGALTFKSSTLTMMGNNLALPASASAPMNQSPALAWDGVPAGTMSFAISMFDATMKNTHWILWDIPVSTMMLPANLPRGAMPTNPAGATQKSAFGGTPGYEGPGAGPGNYEIELWALNVAKLPANIASQSLNTMHTTGLASVKIASVKIMARGQRNGF